MSAAERLLRGEPAGLPASGDTGAGPEAEPARESDTSPAATVDTADADDVAVAGLDIDAALLEIFTRESLEQLEAIAEFVDGCDPAATSSRKRVYRE